MAGRRYRVRVEVPFDDNDRALLQSALGRGHEGDRIAKLVALAGAKEALAQATGAAVFSSITDLRAFRIYCLLDQGMTLDEAEELVARLFKVPNAAAKRMVAQALARYSVELSDGIRASVASMLESAEWAEHRGQWEVQMPAAYLRDVVTEALDRKTLPNPRSAERGALWLLPDETFRFLCEQFGAKPPGD